MTRPRLGAVLIAVALIFGALGGVLVTPAGAATCAHQQVSSDYHATWQYPGNQQVQADVWSPRDGTKQTMSVCSLHQWTATVTQTGVASDGVATYPDSQATYTTWDGSCATQPALSSFTKWHASLALTAPDAGSWDTTFDAFLDNHCGIPLTEVMVLDQYRAIDFPTSQAVTIGGVAYLWYHSGTLIQFRRVNQVASASVNMLKICRWLQARGLVRPDATAQFLAGGVEVLTTGGVPLSFSLTHFAVKAVVS